MNRVFSNGLFAILCIYMLAGCMRENLDDCLEFALTVKIVDAEGKDITNSGIVSTVDLYLFDNNGFIRMAPKGSDVDFLFSQDKSQNLKIVGWGNLNPDSLRYELPEPGTPIEDMMLELLQNADGSHQVANDLFYSRHELGTSTRGMQEEYITLTMTRCVASVSVRALRLNEYFGEEVSGPFRFEVRNTGSMLNFWGESANDLARHFPEVQVDEHGTLSTDVFRVFPAKEDSSILVDIFNGDELLFTVETDGDGEKLRTVAGMHTDIQIDFLATGVQVTITVEPWNTIEQEVEV